jgi:hypothetical protein
MLITQLALEAVMPHQMIRAKRMEDLLTEEMKAQEKLALENKAMVEENNRLKEMVDLLNPDGEEIPGMEQDQDQVVGD